MPISDYQLEILMHSALFKGISSDEIRAFLISASATPKNCKAGTQLVRQGECRPEIHIVLSGSAVGEKIEPDGRAIIVNEFSHGEVFGDVLSGTDEKSPVTVLMTEEGEVITLPFSSLVGGCDCDPKTREKVLRNLITQIAGKYFVLQRRMDILLCQSLREKICSYLLGERDKRGYDAFIVPHTREEQSKLLNCDRSALSRELSRMKREGLIDYKDDYFDLIDTKALGAV